MKFQVYADLELLETILLEADRYKNWNSILIYHSEVYVDMTQAQYDADIALTDDSILFQYLQNSGGKEPIPSENFFNDFALDNSVVVNKPLSAYFLKKNDAEILNLKEKFGLIFQNENIDDKILSNKYQKNCNKNDLIDTNGLLGWKGIMPAPNFYYNTMIITDPHLFNNDRNVNGTIINFGVENILSFLDLILPQNLGVDFHLLLVSSRQNGGFAEAKMLGIYNDLRLRITALRPYNVLFEMVITPITIHRRNSFANYHLINCDKGFKIFSIDDLSKVQEDNQFKYFDIFEITNPAFGDSHCKELIDEIPKIKNGIESALNIIRVVGSNLEDRKCYGLQAGNFIQNRLINYFP